MSDKPRRVNLTVTGRYTAKDQKKADVATCYIGFGRDGSSTAQYAKDFGDLANRGEYTADDVVFVSSNGGATIPLHLYSRNKQVRAACAAGAVIVADTPYHRGRPYNTGERSLARMLESQGYRETNESTEFAVWRRPEDTRTLTGV